VLDPVLPLITAASIAAAQVLAVANIDSPGTELNARAGVSNGALVLCTQNVAATNEWTLYAFDATISTAVNSPYIVAASGSGKWVAVAGKYQNGIANIAGGASVGTGFNVTAGGAAIVGGLQVSGIASASSVTTAGGYTSSVATGTAPFTATSTTVCPNLNVSQLLGSTWAAPGTIGSGTPSTGAFTTLTTTGQITASGRLNTTITDSNTTTASTVMLFDHASSGTPAAGFGSQVLIRQSSDTTANRNAALILTEWVTAADASRTARVSLWAYDATTARECIRVQSSGSAPMLGFYGNGAVVQPTSTTDLRTALINLGLYASGGASPLDLNGGAFNTSGLVTLTNTTDASAIGTASEVLSGGLSVAKQLRVGGNITASGAGGENLFTLGNGTNGFPTVNLRAGSTHYSWFFTAQNAISEAFEIGPSTASGGATYDKPYLIVYQNGSIVLGPRVALATNATDGFVYLPSCAGTPTGVPTSVTGKVASVYDTTNNKHYVYNGAWKASAAYT
jgi:hypothetical protein